MWRINAAEEAWVKALYEENVSKMYNVAARRLGNSDAARDAVQEAFLALITKIEAVKEHPNPCGWLMKALRYLILQKIDAEQKRIENEMPLDNIFHVEAPGGIHISLREMLPPGLSPYDQDLLVWRYENRLTYEEIAERLKIPISTCRTQFFRARKRYQKLAEKEKIFSESM